jgi:hypothetical protein
VLQVSALASGRQAGPTGWTNREDWQRLEQWLKALGEKERWALVSAAGVRGLGRLSEQLVSLIAQRSALLTEPVEQLRTRIGKLEELRAKVERALTHLAHLFAAEHEAITRQLVLHQNGFLEAQLEPALCELHTRLDDYNGETAGLRAYALNGAIEIAEARLGPWLNEEAARAEVLYRQLAGTFLDVANRTLQELRSAEPGLGDLPEELSSESGELEDRPHYHFTELSRLTFQSLPFQRIGDLLRTRRVLRGAVERAAREYLRELLRVNSTRIRNDFDQRVWTSRRKLEDRVRRTLDLVLVTARNATNRALRLQEDGEQAVSTELKRLDELRLQILRL